MKSILAFQKAKESGTKISMVTCYDFWSAKIVQSSTIDCILVGDSVAMTVHGHQDTLTATAELMALHIAAVRKGAPHKLLIGDMPFLAHRGSLDHTMAAVRTLVQAGAQAVKIEGIDGSEETIKHIVESGVPVMGHLGLTPQSLHKFGGFKRQFTEADAKHHLLTQAIKLQNCGSFALVLECVPESVAAYVTEHIKIPTIGIGAGPKTSGQVLVLQDLLGFDPNFKPHFVRTYLSGFELLRDALSQFDNDVKSCAFPGDKESQ